MDEINPSSVDIFSNSNLFSCQSSAVSWAIVTCRYLLWIRMNKKTKKIFFLLPSQRKWISFISIQKCSCFVVWLPAPRGKLNLKQGGNFLAGLKSCKKFLLLPVFMRGAGGRGGGSLWEGKAAAAWRHMAAWFSFPKLECKEAKGLKF